LARQRTWMEWLNPFTRLQRAFSIFAVLWFVAASYLLYRAFTREGVRLPATLAIYLLGTVACSVIAFIAYGIDKRCAVQNRSRISERTLHLFSVFGGWPGAHLARGFFRHKTLKVSFRIVFWIIVACHLLFIGYGMFFGWWVDAIRALL
jgi:uncharacterized membrane protein YsdA (DUF1294 family)